MSVTIRRAGTALGAALLVVPFLAGCGSDRSPEAFCEVMDTHRERYGDSTSEALRLMEGGDMAGLLGGSVGMVQALGDLQLMWDDLVDVAPDDIRGDVEVVRDTTQEQLDAAREAVSDPVGALLGGVLSGLQHGGSYTRVNDYARDHCGTPPF